GMLVRGLTDHPGRLIGVGRDRGLEIHKSIRIAAPVEKVFEFFSDPVQMGGLLPYINRAEPLGDGRVRWHLEGPAGVGHVAFDERIVESVENERMVWESGPDAPVRYAGETRFQPDGDGTRVDLRFVYSPPGGMVADAAASVFGLDPKTLFDRSLNRIKHHLEEGTIPQGASDDAVREHRG
ncbi:MAG TPA: SRPBCC family protein, partial [Planctomycetaceae bacterium]